LLVRERMSAKSVTIAVDTPIAEALPVIRQNLGRRLPVLYDEGRAAGTISEKDPPLGIRETEQDEDINGQS
jgi:CBS-domain-containing membrane protein